MPEVFICHASADQWRADRLCDALEDEGITCWIAPRDVPRDYPRAWGQGALLTKVLDETRLVLLLLSPDAVGSKRIASEIKVAARLQRSCVVAFFDASAAAGHEQLALDRDRTRYVDLSSATGPGYERLTEAVRDALDRPGPTADGPDLRQPFAFVSYKREDFASLRAHLRTLARIDCPVWYDSGIPGGAEWDAMIEARIRVCGFLLVFLSRAAVASKRVRREVKFADKLDKPIVPVLLEPVELGGGLDMLLSQYQIIDSREDDFERRLESAVRSALALADGLSHVLPPRQGTKGPAALRAGQTSGALAARDLTDPEARVLQYLRGKPDVRWTVDVLWHLLDSRPELAGHGPAVERLIRTLAEKGYFRIDSDGRLSMMPKAVEYFRRLT